jgi:hypothetical protein
MEYTQGAFGSPGEDNYINVRNVNANYMFGNLGASAPSFESMQPASSQHMYNPYSRTSPTLEYQTPQYAMHSYGISDKIKYDFLGLSRPIGTNFAVEEMAKHEYRSTLSSSTAWDAAGIAGTVAGSMLGPMTGMAIGGAISSAKDMYFDNARLGQRVNALTGGIRDESGMFGLSGKENTDIAKFIRHESAKDLLMSSEDYESILSNALDSGLMADVGSSSEFKNKAKELAQIVKNLGDAIGSSDFKELTQAMSEFSKIGVSGAGVQQKFVRNESYSAKFAGIADEAMHEQVMAAVQNAKNTGQDRRFAAMSIMGEAADMGLLQQSGGMSTKMNDKRTFLGAAQEGIYGINKFNEIVTGGVSDSLKKVYAHEVAVKEGRDTSEVLKEFLSKSNAEQAELIYDMSEHNKDFRDIRIGGKNTIEAAAAKIDTGDFDPSIYSKVNAMESAYKLAGGKGTSATRLSSMLTTFSQDFSPETMEWLQANSEIFLEAYEAGGKDLAIKTLSKGRNAKKRMMQIDELMNVQGRMKEDDSLANDIMRTGAKVWDYVKTDIVGGFGLSEEIQDEFKRKYAMGLGESGEEGGVSTIGLHRMLKSKKISGQKKLQYLKDIAEDTTYISDFKEFVEKSPLASGTVSPAKSESPKTSGDEDKKPFAYETFFDKYGITDYFEDMAKNGYENGEQTITGKIGETVSDFLKSDIVKIADLAMEMKNQSRPDRAIRMINNKRYSGMSKTETKMLDEHEDYLDSFIGKSDASFASLHTEQQTNSYALLSTLDSSSQLSDEYTIESAEDIANSIELGKRPMTAKGYIGKERYIDKSEYDNIKSTYAQIKKEVAMDYRDKGKKPDDNEFNTEVKSRFIDALTMKSDTEIQLSDGSTIDGLKIQETLDKTGLVGQDRKDLRAAIASGSKKKLRRFALDKNIDEGTTNELIEMQGVIDAGASDSLAMQEVRQITEPEAISAVVDAAQENKGRITNDSMKYVSLEHIETAANSGKFDKESEKRLRSIAIDKRMAQDLKAKKDGLDIDSEDSLHDRGALDNAKIIGDMSKEEQNTTSKTIRDLRGTIGKRNLAKVVSLIEPDDQESAFMDIYDKLGKDKYFSKLDDQKRMEVAKGAADIYNAAGGDKDRAIGLIKTLDQSSKQMVKDYKEGFAKAAGLDFSTKKGKEYANKAYDILASEDNSSEKTKKLFTLSKDYGAKYVSADKMMSSGSQSTLLNSLTGKDSKLMTGQEILEKSGGHMEVTVSKIAADVGIIAKHIAQL